MITIFILMMHLSVQKTQKVIIFVARMKMFLCCFWSKCYQLRYCVLIVFTITTETKLFLLYFNASSILYEY